MGVREGDIPLDGELSRLLLRTPLPRFTLQGGPLVPLWSDRLLVEAVLGHLLLVGPEVPRFHIRGARLKHGGRMT